LACLISGKFPLAYIAMPERPDIGVRFDPLADSGRRGLL
jgi:hypothetical protein